jgi:hypothetical protein
MPTVSSEQQLPPADELFDVRDKIKQLTSRERELKAIVITDPSARTGNHYCVEVKEVETSRTDLQEMRACHADIVEQFTFPVKITRVELRGINEDGELTSLRRKPEKATP